MASGNIPPEYRTYSNAVYASVESTVPLTDYPGWDEQDHPQLNELRRSNANLKRRIRLLRLLSRLASLILSIAAFIPIAMTVHKFLTTHNVYRDVLLSNGTTIHRTAWAADSKVWPTYMYFGVALIALVLDAGILVLYLRSVKTANGMDSVASAFSWVVLIGNLVVWAVAAGIYRYEKDGGDRPKDLWGWTCASAAARIQDVFSEEVEFEKFCGVQSISWGAGIAQAAAGFLSLVIFFWAVRRRQTKKNIRRISHKLTDQY
ncbi:hypothetical protein W97_08934 [Coniosporium apollinis CBS 100218]|uniref:MARVEL domain-containing protein n=1 Tax=Coniosporium apollinis (strain CBS 100218) TaxID=1168221 RepID=R7Z694_CONA1|nr:uncharacterized protein W97_08934 [Coniosporium apollinis CBS 100218]EON69682.1 hypothetical protein W97_08934 [Coniosporium apollinis CBS 100218]